MIPDPTTNLATKTALAGKVRQRYCTELLEDLRNDNPKGDYEMISLNRLADAGGDDEPCDATERRWRRFWVMENQLPGRPLIANVRRRW